jgi:hypothetical protein
VSEHGRGKTSSGAGAPHVSKAAEQPAQSSQQAPEAPPVPPKSDEGFSAKLNWDDFWKHFEACLERALSAVVTRCRPPISVGRIVFSFSNVRDSSMGKICDVTANWPDSPSAGVTVQHVQTSVQAGSNPATVNTTDLPPGATSTVLTAVPAGAVVSVSVIADNGIAPAPASSATFNVPADLTAPAPAGQITFSIGNVRDDTPPPAPPAAVPWTATTAFAAGAVVTPVTPTGHTYSSSGGTSGAAEPAWPTTVGGTVTDGSITWTCLT